MEEINLIRELGRTLKQVSHAKYSDVDYGPDYTIRLKGYKYLSYVKDRGEDYALTGEVLCDDKPIGSFSIGVDDLITFIPYGTAPYGQVLPFKLRMEDFEEYNQQTWDRNHPDRAMARPPKKDC